jgi:hypothetical protein
VHSKLDAEIALLKKEAETAKLKAAQAIRESLRLPLPAN